ncbi:MAG TPA: zinc-dependent metalloprotease [Acidimicrobiia bacterium]|nr:zinc-dependent metalloprotease [Acidimicrobiia bacterium]
MSDDIFSKLFELFDQPGPINWKLAAEVARHLSGEPEPVEPWAAEEFRELARLAEYRIEQIAPFRVIPASDVIAVDARGWTDRNLETFGSLVEPFASSVAADGPAAPLMAQLSPAIIGLQVGSLVGALSTWVVASFDAGLPQEHPGPLTVIVPNIIELTRSSGQDEREVRLWVVANEVAFRAVSQLPWIADHLHQLASAYAGAVKIDPTLLSGLMAGGSDPVAIEQAIDEAGGLEGIIGGEEAVAPRLELEAFLGAITGCARLLARRAIGELSTEFDQISAHRDRAREEAQTAPTIGMGPVPAEATQLGDAFNQEVERRYGDDALETLWADPSRMPTASELRDPTAWAARVLLDGWS